mgnify:FL=1
MLTVKQIRAMLPGEVARVSGTRGAGSLWIKVRSDHAEFVFRYTVSGKTRDMGIGTYDEEGARGGKGLTLAMANAEAAELTRMIQAGIEDPRAHREAEAEAQERAKRLQEAQEAARQREADNRDRFTLASLLGAYTRHLERSGKNQSAKHAASIFKVHVLEADPVLANKPAKEVKRADLTACIRRTHEKGLVRAGGILRAYLSAAFSLAVGAEGDSQAPSEMLGFDLETNPVLGVKAIPTRAGTRVLNREELRGYLDHLDPNHLTDQILRLHLLSGGQRVSQLLRAKVGDFDQSKGELKLMDPKGRRSEPRVHLLPLGPQAASLCQGLAARARAMSADPNPSLFLSDATTPTNHGTPGKRLAAIAEAMQVELFDLRDIRRSVETELAAMGISTDVRANLLSHGLGGVQNQVYNKHGYLREKAEVLKSWEQYLLEVRADNVVPIRASRSN